MQDKIEEERRKSNYLESELMKFNGNRTQANPQQNIKENNVNYMKQEINRLLHENKSLKQLHNQENRGEIINRINHAEKKVQHFQEAI